MWFDKAQEATSCAAFVSFTQYSIDVQPSIVIHWNTVSMANPMLSKLVMPEFGPSHLSRHMLVVLLHTKEPPAFSVVLSVLHGVSDSPSFTSLSVLARKKKKVLVSMIDRVNVNNIQIYIYLDLLSYNKSYAVCPNKTRVQWLQILRLQTTPRDRFAVKVPSPWL